MPGLNGLGPQGNGPIGSRRFGRCTIAPVLVQAVAAQPVQDEMETMVSQDSTQNIPVYGRGRGGVPCGCGRGFGFFGGRRLRK